METLFTLLDWDEKGSVDIDKFCGGCLTLRGVASAFDVNRILVNLRRMSKHLGDVSRRCDELFDVVRYRSDEAEELKAMRRLGCHSECPANLLMMVTS